MKAKPGNDFDRYANGTWKDAYVLKDYETDYGSFDTLADRSEEQINAIIKEMAARQDLAPGSDEAKIRDLYASYMDQAARDARGVAAIKPVLDEIAAIDSKDKLVAAFGHADMNGTNAPIGVGHRHRRKDPGRYLVSVGVGGLGLPDKDYYTNADERFVKIRARLRRPHREDARAFAGVQGHTLHSARPRRSSRSRPRWPSPQWEAPPAPRPRQEPTT
jgi:putative endopeptidase